MVVINVILSIYILIAAVVIPGMIIDYVTGFKYEWISKALDKLFSIFIPMLLASLFICIFAAAGLLLYAIWCM